MTGGRILLFGAKGQLGTSLARALAPLGAVAGHDRLSCDLTDFDHLREIVRAARPDVVINAAAYTAVDRAEGDEALCRRVNAQAPRVMAQEAAALGALFVHYSTDYVFDGTKAGAYAETDTPRPLNVYGRTKVEADEAILAMETPALILRIGWVYSAVGHNFVKTMLRLAAERDTLRVVDDQIGTPTSADFIAAVTVRAVMHYQEGGTRSINKSHLYHVAPGGKTSWHGFAVELIREAIRRGRRLKVDPERIMPIPASEYPTPALRPRNSTLNTRKIHAALSLEPPDWREEVRRVTAELCEAAQ